MSALKGFWICFDLGLKGDYPGMYKYLDSHKGIECGGNIAYMKREIVPNFKEIVRQEIIASVKINSDDRVYLIYKEPQSTNTCGYFIFGGRKKADWDGFNIIATPDVVDSE